MISLSDLDESFFSYVQEKSGQPIELCFQCQKCTSGCPMAELSDYYPNQVIRMIRFGLRERVLESKAIWLCLSCEACSVRCPNGIHIPAVMDVLRTMAVTGESLRVQEKDPIFHRIFLDSVKSNGRVHELMLMVKYKLKTGDVFSDIPIGLKMFRKGKLPLISKGVKNKTVIRKIFDKIEKNG
ncbi:4Fe-4S dicluster domain-containing protein [Desulfofundulus sp.]|uniref:4Fe-4S dicluster domain-containing protein n=1 Tax=Desulfofundulus sp. TaxID=2282750 RepID=UPI003C707AC8